MDGKAIRSAIDMLVKEKGINEEYLFDSLELALTSAYKKLYSLQNVHININRDTGEIHIYSFKTVLKDQYTPIEEIPIYDEEGNQVDEETFIFDDRIYITIDEAKKLDASIQVGDTIEEEIDPKDFSRVAASTAKQVIIQKVREAERNNIIEEYGDKQDEMVSGLVAMEDQRNYYIDLGKTQGILPKSETIPGETIRMGSNIRVYISKVESNSKGPLILLSRTHYGFVKRLFELEIPEINEGIILVESVARDAGNRTKIAVSSINGNIDAVGSCIGEKGSRIAAILKELNGEKIDIVPFSKNDSEYIANALSPAKDLHIFITDEKKREAMVVVNQENLSLAIGKKGSNVRLAARLTHYKLDVKTIEQAHDAGIHIVE